MPFDLPWLRRSAMILWLGDSKRDAAIEPTNHRHKADIITEDPVRRYPAIQIFQRRGRCKFDHLTESGNTAPEINKRQPPDFWD